MCGEMNRPAIIQCKWVCVGGAEEEPTTELTVYYYEYGAFHVIHIITAHFILNRPYSSNVLFSNCSSLHIAKVLCSHHHNRKMVKFVYICFKLQAYNYRRIYTNGWHQTNVYYV